MSSIEIRVYNPSLQLQGIIDEFSDLIWIRRYQDPGEFELRTPYADESRRLLVPGNVIQKYDGSVTYEAGVVENIVMTTDTITVKGRFLESYLDRRLIKETTYYQNNVEDSIRGIISSMVSIPLLELGTDHGLTETLRFQATYKTVLAIVSKACKATALGFRIRPDFSARKLYFEVYKGADNTQNVIFSDTYDNLYNEQYTYDNTNLKSKIYATQTIDNVRRYVTVGGGTGLDLREGHIQTSVDTNGLTDAYIKLSMEEQAQRALEQHIVYESFTFATDTEAPFAYQTDYDIGDQVSVNHTTWGISLSSRITEIEEDYSGGDKTVILTCGSPLPEIVDFEE